MHYGLWYDREMLVLIVLFSRWFCHSPMLVNIVGTIFTINVLFIATLCLCVDMTKLLRFDFMHFTIGELSVLFAPWEKGKLNPILTWFGALCNRKILLGLSSK